MSMLPKAGLTDFDSMMDEVRTECPGFDRVEVAIIKARLERQDFPEISVDSRHRIDPSTGAGRVVPLHDMLTPSRLNSVTSLYPLP